MTSQDEAGDQPCGASRPAGQEGDGEAAPWLFLIHQVPPKPGYLRVKVWRRLQRLGAVPVKNSVYVLPNGSQAREDFAWLLREIVDEGGEAVGCEVRIAAGLTDAEVEAMFRSARDEDYLALAREANEIASGLDKAAEPAKPGSPALARLRKRFGETAAIDFHAAPARRDAETALAALEGRLRREESGPALDLATGEALRGRTWVTRSGVFVDRIASAWLIQRFVDPAARFRFVGEARFRPAPGELRFDIYDGEFTHQGDRCTFEVLLERLGLLGDPGLVAVAGVVHDIDLKDGKFGRPETPGIELLLAGIARAEAADERRIGRGAALFDTLYASFTPPSGGS
ncbi:MAG: chromate resistance protein [Gemmatimonadetes bacterium]|nr:chromate resistance protein [Gemmatimonadota bacterium]